MTTTERVDKAWQQKGLKAYSTEAIFGTLRHYGAAVDEAAFKGLAETKYPLEIAQSWQAQWKGTGQFARFHLAAADELTSRLFPDRLMAVDVAQALVDLMKALGKMMEGAADAPVGQSFAKFDAMKPRVPRVDGKPEVRFVNEVNARMGEWTKIFGQLAQELAKEGHIDDAEQFADIEEFLMPQWAGVSRAMVRAGKGESAEAIKDLVAITQDPNREGPGKATAIDGLLHLGALPEAKDAALTVFEQAETSKDFHLAMEVGERLMFVVEKIRDHATAEKIVPRLQKIHDEHSHAHPHH
jgi:hypothetical protein